MRPLLALVLLVACGDDDRSPLDASDASLDANVDANVDANGDAGDTCVCLPGIHTENIFVISDGGEVWRYNPRDQTFEFVVGPVCAGMTPFSMAVDADGVAWINIVDSLAVVNLDLLDPGSCSDSSYSRRDPDFGLFGMSFASNSAADVCADLYVMTYSGDGSFEEGPDLGKLGAIDPATGDLRVLGNTDFDGGELTGTGDGRLFGFAGDLPVKLIEYDKETGAVLRIIPLDGVRKTNASAAAFFGGDIYLFTEETPAECEACLVTECGDALADCRADAVCNDHLECVLTTPVFSDECGGGLSETMASCVPRCEPCVRPGRARVSRVLRFDLDESEGGGFTQVASAPIRVVGAASSPCVPVGPI